jgi:hypothetical protein
MYNSLYFVFPADVVILVVGRFDLGGDAGSFGVTEEQRKRVMNEVHVTVIEPLLMLAIVGVFCVEFSKCAALVVIANLDVVFDANFDALLQ